MVYGFYHFVYQICGYQCQLMSNPTHSPIHLHVLIHAFLTSLQTPATAGPQYCSYPPMQASHTLICRTPSVSFAHTLHFPGPGSAREENLLCVTPPRKHLVLLVPELDTRERQRLADYPAPSSAPYQN